MATGRKKAILKIVVIGIICVTIGACSSKKQSFSENLLDYVDPLIGTGGHGHTFLGASVPFGAIQVGPNNFFKGWDWCSGFHVSDSILIGFSHLHLSGTGSPELGDILVMPASGSITPNPGSQEFPDSGYASKYRVETIVAKPSYFKMLLDRYAIQAELSATERVAFHRYNYSQDKGNAQLLIDLEAGNEEDKITNTYLRKNDDFTIVGYRYSSSWWAKDQRVYFALKTNLPIDTLSLYENEKILSSSASCEGMASKGILSFAKGTKELLIKIGISPVDMDGALRNIDKEIPHWNFEQVVMEGSEKWNEELSKVRVETTDEKEKVKFYTARYHTMIAPSLFNDSDGAYRGADSYTYPFPGFNNYTIFSLWDTYRAAHPLLTLLNPERIPDIINTMLDIYDRQGKLPVWHLAGCETDIMVGYHAVPVIVDAYLKGFTNFDTEKALEAMLTSSNREDNASILAEEYGYIPSDEAKVSVAKTLEYAIDDWCIARFAKELGKDDIYKRYMERAQNYQNVFDTKTGFFRGKTSDGEWVKDFNPVRSIHLNDVYCEGNAWQYAWLVPHDVKGLIKLHGGEKRFSAKLDSLFIVQGDLGENASADISGLIGMYAHGNEPGHHTIYLYPYVGEQWKTAEKARQIMQNMYSDRPDGIIGNEDCGQMSAWYIFSSFGFYPVNPANGMYVFGSPIFDRIGIELPNDREFVIETINNSPKNVYIDKVELNGKSYDKSYIMHSDIIKGGILKFYMSNIPNKDFGKMLFSRPFP